MQKHEYLFEKLSPFRLFLKCALPSMVSMAMTALYTVADGIFVGHFLGEGALAAVNLVMPLITIGFALSDMIAVGSSVQIAMHLGKKQTEEANRIFTVCSLLIVGVSSLMGLLGFFCAEPLLRLMGADAAITALAAEYLQVFALFAPVIMVFFAVDNYLRICGRPRYSMVLNVLTSVLNIVLDFLFLGVWNMGIGAASLASCASLTLGTLLGFLPFFRGKLPLRFVRGGISPAVLGGILVNGSSEFFSSIAGSLLMLILNSVLLRLAGATAVAAFSIVLYVDSVVASLLYGLADSVQPAISYCYGARLRRRVFSLEKHMLAASAVISLCALAGMWLGGEEIVSLFIPQGGQALLDMSLRAMKLFSLTYLTGWVATGLSAFFTATNRAGSSLGLSLCRALCFPLLCLAVLPQVLGLDGVWLAAPVGGLLAAVLALLLLGAVLRRERAAN